MQLDSKQLGNLLDLTCVYTWLTTPEEPLRVMKVLSADQFNKFKELWLLGTACRKHYMRAPRLWEPKKSRNVLA